MQPQPPSSKNKKQAESKKPNSKSTDSTVRLNKVIADSGLCSRRHADALISEGLVTVNGSVVKTLGTQVSPTSDKILVNGKALPSIRPIYVVFHKPKGYLTTRHDTHDRQTIYDLLPESLQSVDSAGRLDRDSTGLLVLSNDGDFIHRLTHPSFQCVKTYRVTTAKPLSEEAARQLLGSILLKPENKAAQLTSLSALPVDRSTPNEWPYEVTLLTGYNRQIRRSFEAVGFPVTKLKRTAFSFLRLGQLKPGEYRFLKPTEIERLLKDKSDRKNYPSKRSTKAPSTASSKTSKPTAKKRLK